MAAQTSFAGESRVAKGAANGRARNDDSNALGQIDDVLDSWSVRRRDFHHEQVGAEDERQEFAEGLAGSVPRLSLESIAQRLKACGGDGMLVLRPRSELHGLHITLWMALHRKIEVLDRPDMYPYVRLDLDVAHRTFFVLEGDRWEQQGASRSAVSLQLSDITVPFVADQVVANPSQGGQSSSVLTRTRTAESGFGHQCCRMSGRIPYPKMPCVSRRSAGSRRSLDARG